MNPDPATRSAPGLEAIHDFGAKLRQPSLRPAVLEYVQWRRQLRAARAAGAAAPPMPPLGPASINLDLTTACNYACDHCIDWDALNLPLRHQDDELRDSLREMARRGLRSVILIGGGEPTMHRGFCDMVRFLKQELGVQLAVVSNGSRNQRIAEVAHLFERGDWVRLSLDAGSDEVFQAMHNPKGQGIDLQQICASAALIKDQGPEMQLGFSFVITWKGALRDSTAVVENLHEMEQATALASRHGFDYISFKPFLNRAEEGAEVMDPGTAQASSAAVVAAIETGLAAARKHENASFRVIASTNLQVFLQGRWQDYTVQPRECHMQWLRQVVSPLGVYNCPAHRGVYKARVGGAAAWAGGGSEASAGTARLLDEFDASQECAEVTCLYHPVNHLLEGLIDSDEDLDQAFPRGAEGQDSFL